MTKKTQRLHSFAKLPLALAVAASMSNPAGAFQFYMGDWEANLDTTLSAGASWRVEDRDPRLVGIGNGGEGGSINSDNGNLNFDKGDVYSKIVKGSTDFLLNGGDYGAFVRAKYWYDFQLRDEDHDYPLSDDGKNNAAGAEILDAYIFADYWLGDTPLNLRIGKQVVSWGESTFIFNGINVINPVEVGAIRAPGAEVKEALLPVNMVYGSLGLTENLTLEAFVQLEHEVSRIDDCGTFFSTVDYVADGCAPVFIANSQTEDINRQGVNGDYQWPTALPRMADKEADDTDQFGVALRWFVPDLNETEFGFYFIQYHSRLPLVSGVTAQDRNGDNRINTLLEGVHPDTGAKYFIEYPEQIKLLGVSFNTTGPGGISLGGEYSFKKDVPLQLNSPDLVAGALGNAYNGTQNNDIVYSPIFQDRVQDTNGDGYASVDEAGAQGFYGVVQPGYDLYDVSQLQFTGIKFVDQFMGASRLVLVGEVGATYVHDLPDVDQIRYGRFDQTSFGLTADYAGTGENVEACLDINKVGECNQDGYVTSFSWGYRARAALTYNDVFAGVNLTPQLALSHDVKGHAPAPGANFVEGRKSVGLSVKGEYLNQYSASLGYTSYFGGEPYNAIVDRDNVALSVSYSF